MLSNHLATYKDPGIWPNEPTYDLHVGTFVGPPNESDSRGFVQFTVGGHVVSLTPSQVRSLADLLDDVSRGADYTSATGVIVGGEVYPDELELEHDGVVDDG